jgi:hypothetical protein
VADANAIMASGDEVEVKRDSDSPMLRKKRKAVLDEDAVRFICLCVSFNTEAGISPKVLSEDTQH